MHRYVGDGAILPGIPARDIPDDEWRELKRTVNPDIDQARIYERVDDREHPRLAARAEKQAEAEHATAGVSEKPAAEKEG